MFGYIIKKILYSCLIVFGVVSLIFLLFNMIPGDPARMVMGQRTDSASLAAARHDLGLDKPLGYQYLKYLNDLSPVSVHNPSNPHSYIYLDTALYSGYVSLLKFGGNRLLVLKYPYLRRSYQSRKTVTAIIGETLPNTFILALSAMVFATAIGIFLGVIAAIKKDTFFDRIALVTSAFGMSLPSFFAAILIGWAFAVLLGKYTGLNLTGNLWVVDDFGEGIHLELKNLVLPTLTLGLRPVSIVTQLTRSAVLETLDQDYVRTAKAKGLKFPAIIRKHVLKNSLNPVVTAVSGWFASLMAGVIFVEYIFGWKGLGYVMVSALNSYDVPLVIGCVVSLSLIFVVINLLVDVVYSMLDPRVKLG
ncbi:MAG: ABC transporter permease [Bacteroidales bacterium]